MRNKRVKNYWRKIRERYTNIDKAKERVGVLRAYDNSEVSFVRLKKEKDEHIIEYSVPIGLKNNVMLQELEFKTFKKLV